MAVDYEVINSGGCFMIGRTRSQRLPGRNIATSKVQQVHRTRGDYVLKNNMFICLAVLYYIQVHNLLSIARTFDVVEFTAKHHISCVLVSSRSGLPVMSYFGREKSHLSKKCNIYW